MTSGMPGQVVFIKGVPYLLVAADITVTPGTDIDLWGPLASTAVNLPFATVLPTGVAATDTSTINQAVQAAQSEGGGLIEIGPGELALSAPIAITGSNVAIQGAGIATQLFVVNNANIQAAVTLTGTGVTGCQVRNLMINGNQSNQTNGDGIYVSTPWANSSTGLTDPFHVFEDLFIFNCKNNGFEVGTNADTREMKLMRVHVKNCAGNGFLMHYPSCTDSHFITCTADTIALNGFFCGGANNTFIGCKTFYCGSAGGNNHGWYIVGYNQYFDSCQAQDNYQSGFYGDNSGDATYGSFGCVFTGCTADSNGQNGSVTTYSGASVGLAALNSSASVTTAGIPSGVATSGHGWLATTAGKEGFTYSGISGASVFTGVVFDSVPSSASVAPGSALQLYAKGFQINGPNRWQISGGLSMNRPYGSFWQDYGISLESGANNCLTTGVGYLESDNITGYLDSTGAGSNVAENLVF